MAYASSLRSADLSRQVGAVVAKNNEILSSGANDCPKYGGGLYWPELKNGEYIDEDGGRDYKLGFDSNKDEQKKIITAILSAFCLDDTDENQQKIKAAGIGELTEYGRVVHAEMEALLSCARNNIDCRGANMYMTTFPCHNCAKHIIAAGIENVFYIEPYPKSKAFFFYKNEITDTPTTARKVHFLPFSGVGPRRYIDLFSMNSSLYKKRVRKNSEGKCITFNRSSACPRSTQGAFSYLENELSACASFQDYLEKKMETI